MNDDLQTLKTLAHGKDCNLNWHEEGGGLVHKVWDVWVLFEVPQYGGPPRYVETYSENELSQLLDEVYKWT